MPIFQSKEVPTHSASIKAEADGINTFGLSLIHGKVMALDVFDHRFAVLPTHATPRL